MNILDCYGDISLRMKTKILNAMKITKEMGCSFGYCLNNYIHPVWCSMHGAVIILCSSCLDRAATAPNTWVVFDHFPVSVHISPIDTILRILDMPSSLESTN